ncbi:MAG TPA: hypothetical protein VHZ24_03820 [Pirellulales bacterium]|nr:hypothetical protein [Pirellulales bacterium]
MKFQLAPYNRGLSDDVILDDLRGVAQKLRKEYVTKEECNEHGRLSASALQKRFGSWCKAHKLAGLRKIRHYDATADDICYQWRQCHRITHHATACLPRNDSPQLPHGVAEPRSHHCGTSTTDQAVVAISAKRVRALHLTVRG